MKKWIKQNVRPGDGLLGLLVLALVGLIAVPVFSEDFYRPWVKTQTLTATTGTITTLTAPTIAATNIDAGASGTAGTVDVFPATASKGKLIVSCTNNTTDHTMTLTNGSVNAANVTVTIPPLTGYVGLSTAALTLAEMDVLDAVTPGTATANKVLVMGASKEIATITSATITTLTAPTVNATDVDAGASGTAGTVDIFPATPSKGKLAITAANSAGDTTTTLVNASQAGARTYTIPDAGAAANFCLLVAAQTTAGELKRADLTEEALQPYGIPINQIMAADGAPLAVTETAGDHFLNLGTNTINLRGEEAISETETSVSYIQFILPPEYVAAGDVNIRIRCKIDGAGTNNGSTVDIEVYEQADMAVGADLCTTAAQTFAAKSTWYNKDFVVTATGLVAGDILIIKLTSSVIENAGSALAFYSDPPKIMLDIKG